MDKIRTYLFALLMVFLPIGLVAQATVTGSVTDAETGEPLAGANVLVEGTDLGAAADVNGAFTIQNVPAGMQTVTASVIGYDVSSKSVNVPSSGTVEVDFSLTLSAIEVAALEVLAGRARHRQTPVAFSDVTEEDLQLRVASRDLPMILNETPGVYASMEGGGAGDSRLNVRGFDQRNTAILINGVPVNDMENGWVYWSNWDGMADVTSSIQVQRGLGASNLAIASVGGTVNVLTTAAETKKGLTFKQEVGSDNFLKSTLTYSTGRMSNGFSSSVLLQRKTGDGWVDGTWTNAWAYFLTVNKPFGDHIFDLTLLGAPQQHGQRRGNAHTVEEWNDVLGGDLRKNTGWNGSYDGSGAGWGYVSKENYDSIKMGTDESTDWISELLFGGIQHTRKLGDKYIINNRTNYYHKPVYNLNWFWKINDRTSLSTVFYGSNGRGGGTGGLNSRGNAIYWSSSDSTYKDAYQKYMQPDQSSETGEYDWDGLIAYNRDGTGTWMEDDTISSKYATLEWNEGKPFDLTYSATERRSKVIIRASVNHHNWYGAISTIKHRLNDNIRLSAGFDVRTYAGLHYREIVNLLGGDYYVDSSDKNDVTAADRIKKIGDKVAYHNNGYNTWFGGFGQAEYTSGQISAFGSLALSSTNYKREDFFIYTPGEGQVSDVSSHLGYAFKMGANYNLTEAVNVFANVGRLSIAPNFDAIFPDFTNTINEDAKNEGVTSFEIGAGYTAGMIAANANYYYTLWENKTITKFSDDLIYSVPDLDAVHSGLELDVAVAVMPALKVVGAFAVADWKWNSDVTGSYYSDNDPQAGAFEASIYAKGIHVGDAPQTQASFGAIYTPIRGLRINPVVKYYASHYAAFDPADRKDESDRDDSYMFDPYTLVDLHGSYRINLGNFPLELGFHLLNATDLEYFSDGDDGSSHTKDDVEVYYGLGRRFNISLNTRF